MGRFAMGMVGLLAALGLLWIRQTKVTRPWLRRLLMVLMVLLFYPVLNDIYATLKEAYAAGQRDAASSAPGKSAP